MLARKWGIQFSLTVICLGLGVLLVAQLRTQRNVRQGVASEDWEYVVADLIDSNARLREEIETLQSQLAGILDTQGGEPILQSLVDEVNHLRIVNGLVEVSGPGVEVEIDGPISVLDLNDLINELRNAGAEALALNGHRIVAWSAISTDGERVTVDGEPVQARYSLEAIGDASTLEVAIVRPGGLVSLLQQVNPRITITVHQKEKLTLPQYSQPLQFAYTNPVE
jgi:uncharacterized protein YlxW (UPF0749 family)